MTAAERCEACRRRKQRLTVRTRHGDGPRLCRPCLARLQIAVLQRRGWGLPAALTPAEFLTLLAP